MRISTMASHIWLFAVLLLIPVLAEVEEEEVEVADEYVDEILDNLRNNKDIIEKIDPFHVPYIDQPKFKGSNMRISGLLSLHRSGDCFISHDGDNIYILGHLAVNNIIVELDYKFKALFWISGHLKATLNRLGVRIRLSLHVDTKKPNLEEFKVTEFGTFAISKITGLSFLLNWALRLIVQSIANKSKPQIIEILEVEIAKIVRDGLGKIEFPTIY